MPIKYDITKDALYLQGIEKGRLEGKENSERERIRAEREKEKREKTEEKMREVYLSLMKTMSMASISKQFGVSLYYLRKIKREKQQEKQSESNQ